MILLFANSFGAQATAYQLTACQVNLVTCVIRLADARRRAPQRRPRLLPGHGHGRDHGRGAAPLRAPPAASGAVAEVTAGPGSARRACHRRLAADQAPPGIRRAGVVFAGGVVILVVAAIYFLRRFSRRSCSRSKHGRAARLLQRLERPGLLGSLLFSFVIAFFTIVAASRSWCRPPTGSGCAIPACGPSWSS